MMTHEIIDFLQNSPDVLAHITITSADDLRAFPSQNNQHYLYLISWEEELEFGAWGTSSNPKRRLRNAMVFHDGLTGKYDRRVDYLIARRLWGYPIIRIFSIVNKDSALRLEQEIGTHVVHPNRPEIEHCFYCHTENDIPASRQLVSQRLLNLFEQDGFNRAPPDNVTAFMCYWNYIFLRPDEQPNGFRNGDSLEPRYLSEKYLNVPPLAIESIIAGIQNVLGVHNLRGGEL